ncbi:PTS sugar transporter [Herbiconiux sp. CPCC 205716]|uniref:PTS sugar transporter n=1 Tax=Herbiconiux gentiana TaxID=2970912 RepID=A0ABT2GF89_9MICO|nr:PTS sugar transporter [Herbiconiux gentiana]MCS5714848.1 PTS sugar transporter [Herbiconiux gentiana]
MDRVLIVCGAGASSTFLAVRLRRIIRDRDLDLVVDAGTLADLDDRLAATRILLVGPHLADRFAGLAERAERAGAVAELLPENVFGRDGAELAARRIEELAGLRSPADETATSTPIKGVHHG